MLRIRDIQTKTVPQADGSTTIEPVLDAEGREIENWSVLVPTAVVNKGPAAVEAYVKAARAGDEAVIAALEDRPAPAVIVGADVTTDGVAARTFVHSEGSAQ